MSMLRAALSAGMASMLLGVAPAAASDAIDRLAWLAGCWAAERGESGSGEMWMAPGGGSLLGIGRTVRGGRTVEHEFMQIRAGADGKLAFIALPSGQRETTFVLVSQAEREVAFENPQHDFPTRVAYRLLPDDRLIARIEGQRDGRLGSIEFHYKRVACERAK